MMRPRVTTEPTAVEAHAERLPASEAGTSRNRQCGCEPEGRTRKKKRHSALREDGKAVITSPRLAVVKVLADQRLHDGFIPEPVLEREAERLDLAPDYLSRLVRQFIQDGSIPDGRPGSTKKLVLPDVHRAQVAYFLYKGNAVKAYKFLKSRDLLPTRMDIRTFQRRVLEWDPALRACAKGGYRAMVENQFFNTDSVPYRTYAYGTDHTYLPIMVVTSSGSTKPVWVWLTTIIDLRTRVLMAYKVTQHTPNAIDSIDALVEAIHGWYTEDGVFVGGKPGYLRSDRGGDYVSDAFSANLMAFHIEPQFTEPYSSWQNGVVERFNGTIDSDFAPNVPGFHPGGEAEYTRRVLKTPIPVTSLLTIDTLDRRLGDFFGDYNNRPHSALNGRTPLQAWAEDEYPIELADRDTVLTAMSSRSTRRLNKYGIEIRGAIYSHPTLALLRRANVKDVEVRFHEHDKDHIEVYVNGTHECTATKASAQSEHQKFGVLSVRAKQRREMERLTREADRERILEEREKQREEGTAEADLPVVPELPAVFQNSEDHSDTVYDEHEDGDFDGGFDPTITKRLRDQMNTLGTLHDDEVAS